jgi:hypothetical protein
MKTGLEALVKGKGTPCSIDPPRRQSTWNSIIRQLGCSYVYGPLDALKEFITNASDAGAKNITITLQPSKKGQSSILVSDDGHGMFLPPGEEIYIRRSADQYEDLEIEEHSILRIPKKIGDSVKRFEPTQHGDKAIGALAWQTLGDFVAFISKKKGWPMVAWSCSYQKRSDPKNPNQYVPLIVREKDQPNIAKYLTGPQGTTVVLDKISNEVMGQLRGATLQKDLGSRFRDLIKEKDVKITIKGEKGKRYVVEPEVYQGKVLLKETVQTKKGPIDFEIYISPNKKGEVRIKHGLQTLVPKISMKRNHLKCDAWSSGYLSGQIRADWLTASATRQDMENDANAEIFFTAVRKYNKKVQDEVDKFKDAASPVKRRQLYNHMSKAFAAMLGENPQLEDLLTEYRATKRGKNKEGQPDDDTIAPPGTGKSGGKSKGGSQRRKSAKLVDQTAEGATTSKQLTLRFDENSELGPDVMSEFNKGLGLITFNSAHPEYIRVMDDAQRKKMYLAGLVGKELLSKIYHHPVELADKVIAFQQGYFEYLKVG